jgi:hypothetical protein
MTEAEAFRITRTNSRNYVGICDIPGCGFTTNRIRFRVDCGVRMRDHCQKAHGLHPGSFAKYLNNAAIQQQKEESAMKSPKKDLPALERLSEYEGHLCVFAGASFGKVKSQYGTSECDCLVWVYNKSQWKPLGETPIFWQTVGKQILEEIGPDSDTPDESMGGYLRKGGHPTRSGDFFWIEDAQDKPDLDALKAWNKEYSDSF